MTDTMTPTLERISHARGRYEPPLRDQATDRPAGRVLSCWDLFERARGGADPVLTPEQAMAGREISLYYGAIHDVRSVTCSYGEPRFNGTPASQVAGLLGPEYRETCRRRLIRAELAVAEAEDWDALIAVVSRDGTARDAGRALGYVGRSQQIAKGVASLRRSLEQLARHFGFTTGPGSR